MERFDFAGMPKPSEIGYLDPELANEGEAVLLSDGERVNWTPPPVDPVIPRMDQVRSLRRYFGRTGLQVYPAWLYHPTKDAVVVKSADEARKLGVMYRQATEHERGRYGVRAVWDFDEGCDWRPAPWETKFDPKNPGAGKTFIAGTPAPVSQTALIAEVAAAVTTALKASGPSAPAHIDPKQWDAFLAFQAWQKSSEVVPEAVAAEVPPPSPQAESFTSSPPGNALHNAVSPEDERRVLEAEANAKGIKTDGRWSLDRLRGEVQKAA